MKTKTLPSNALYVTNAHVVDPSQKIDREMDLLSEEGKILAVGKPGELKAKAKALRAEVIQAHGLHLVPGFVDLHCSIHEPGGEHIESFSTGSRAAAAGGFTTLLVKPVSNPVNDNAFMTDFVLRRAQENSLTRVIPMGALTAGREGKKLAELGSMAQAGVRAVGDGLGLVDSYLMRKALEYAKAFSLPVFSFPSDPALAGQGVMHEGINSNRLGLRGIPSAAEEIAVARDVVIAQHTGGTLHFQSVSTKGALEHILRAKDKGLNVTAETSPAYFTLTHESIVTYDANYKCFPPLRTEEDREAIIRALADGTLDILASGHNPQTKSAKEQSFELAASGMSSLETALPLALELVRKKMISLSRLIELMCLAPAKRLGIENEVGTLRVGAYADLVLIDTKEKFVFKESCSASSNSPFFGRNFQGRVKRTFVGGTAIYVEKGKA